MGTRALILAAAAAGLTLATSAIAADTFLTIPGISYHLQRHRGYNEINTGIGLEHELSADWRLGGGVYRNSIRKDSYYAGAIYTPYTIYGVKIGTSLGIVTGYGNPLPMALPTLIYEGREYGVNVVLVPPIAAAAKSGVIGMQMKWRFP